MLIFEGSFPNKFGNWHTRELISFLKNRDTDILVTRFNSFAGVNFDVDLEVISRFVPPSLTLYFLIFDPKFNFLQSRNPLGFDGTLWNNRYPGSYVVATRPTFSLSDYTRIYAIFLSQLHLFNENYGSKLKSAKKYVHLYGGGGFDPRVPVKMNPGDTAIVNHPITSKVLRKQGILVKDVWGGPAMFQNEKIVPRNPPKPGVPFGVAFSMIGFPKEKGLHRFHKIVNYYKLIFPKDRVQFYFIGNSGNNDELLCNVELLPPMAFWDLENFYKTQVHVYLSLTTKQAFNGWPMGIEAMKHGVVVLSSDPHRQRDLIPGNSGATFIRSTFGFAFKIHSLYQDVSAWRALSIKGQSFVQQYCSYEEQQSKIMKILED